jgi:hypothetical protein
MGVSTLDDRGLRKWWVQQSWVWKDKRDEMKVGIAWEELNPEKLEEQNSEKL